MVTEPEKRVPDLDREGDFDSVAVSVAVTVRLKVDGVCVREMVTVREIVFCGVTDGVVVLDSVRVPLRVLETLRENSRDRDRVPVVERE